MRSLLMSVLLLGATLTFAAAPLPRSIAPVANKLIDKLGDDDVDVRKAAIKQLVELGEEVIPILRRAAKTHSDVDVRLRANVVAADIEKMLFGEIRSFKGHSGWVYRMALTPDGKK